MLTINDQANKEIIKAKRAISKAIDILVSTPEYNNGQSIFHNTTVYDVNRLITASKTLSD